MGFLRGGKQAVTFTKNYLRSGKLVLKDSVRIMAINYLPEQSISEGANEFLKMSLPQVQFKNPTVQILTFANLAPTPFIQCHVSSSDSSSSSELLIDCSFRKPGEILGHLQKILGKTEDEIEEENLRKQIVVNPANFGHNYPRQCMCEVFGQVPCSVYRSKAAQFVQLRQKQRQQQEELQQQQQDNASELLAE